ncbi:MAG: GTPase domain-containing protein [Chloroflexota bacterium]|nr:GTPase domain-containing protein [Chloroflexota bacterium]
MFINWKLREINLKVVYYGPALSGKTTNLQYIHAKTNPQIRGELISLKTRGDRTLYFDFLQLELGQIAGLKPRFNLYTVPGQVYYVGSRKLVIQGADGVVFVADSQLHRLAANVETVRDMEENLRTLGYNPRTIPLVLQCNKRDLPNIAPIPLMQQQLGLDGKPCFASVAIHGNGVFDTLKAIVNLVVGQAQRQL